MVAGAFDAPTGPAYGHAKNKILVWVSVLLVVVFGGRALVQHMSRSANENAATNAVEVSCTIDGRRATILAVRDRRLEWVD